MRYLIDKKYKMYSVSEIIAAGTNNLIENAPIKCIDCGCEMTIEDGKVYTRLANIHTVENCQYATNAQLGKVKYDTVDFNFDKLFKKISEVPTADLGKQKLVTTKELVIDPEDKGHNPSPTQKIRTLRQLYDFCLSKQTSPKIKKEFIYFDYKGNPDLYQEGVHGRKIIEAKVLSFDEEKMFIKVKPFGESCNQKFTLKFTDESTFYKALNLIDFNNDKLPDLIFIGVIKYNKSAKIHNISQIYTYSNYKISK
ncbi:MAG: hypothetical protein ACRCUP_03415 [Mycoplasmatales bacterium]